MTRLTFEYVSKSFGDVEALVGLNLDIGSAEFFALVGSSGCGKSTAMRIAGGLETPDHGQIRIDGTVITNVPPRDREFGLVTQQNALVSNRTAGRNISLPLEARMLHQDDISSRVSAEAERLGVRHLLGRRRSQLSGGETQAVQLARALVARPKVLLLDEPLARIDSDVRLKLRGDLLRIQQQYELTTLLITADQEDAMVLADRIAVLDRGRLQQIGPPMDLYRRPVNTVVAAFLGDPPMNLLTVDVVDELGLATYRVGDCHIPTQHGPARALIGRAAVIGIRPEDVRLDGVPGRSIPATVDRVENRGPSTVLHLRADGLRGPGGEAGIGLSVSCRGMGPRIGEHVGVVIDPGLIHLFDAFTGAALLHPL